MDFKQDKNLFKFSRLTKNKMNEVLKAELMFNRLSESYNVEIWKIGEKGREIAQQLFKDGLVFSKTNACQQNAFIIFTLARRLYGKSRSTTTFLVHKFSTKRALYVSNAINIQMSSVYNTNGVKEYSKRNRLQRAYGNHIDPGRT